VKRMHHQNTAPPGAPQAFAKKQSTRHWISLVKKKERGDEGRNVCKQNNVCPRLVAEVAEEFLRLPSFEARGEIWGGQKRLGVGPGVKDRQVRRALSALKALNLLRVRRRGQGLTNRMTALYKGHPLFPENADTGSSTSYGNWTCMSYENRTQASSNPNEEETQKYTSPVGPSKTATWETPTTQEEEGDLDELRTEGTCSRAELDSWKGNPRGHGAERAASFSRLLSDYPHPAGQREKPAYEPMARRAWAALSDAQRAEAIDAAPHAPGKTWLGHWLNDARETGIFDTVKQTTAGPRVWVSEGTPQHAAWAEYYRSRGCHLPRTQHRIAGELRTGWMFESEWPPNFNFVQPDGRAA
jgi:hypothetical protein